MIIDAVETAKTAIVKIDTSKNGPGKQSPMAQAPGFSFRPMGIFLRIATLYIMRIN
jgi:hypothetical protein